MPEDRLQQTVRDNWNTTQPRIAANFAHITYRKLNEKQHIIFVGNNGTFQQIIDILAEQKELGMDTESNQVSRELCLIQNCYQSRWHIPRGCDNTCNFDGKLEMVRHASAK